MIPLFKPQYTQADLKGIYNVLNSRWTGMGSQVDKFEELFAEYIGTRYAVAVNSGTAALNLALYAPIKGSVITTPISFISTLESITGNGHTPIFCDVDKDTMNMDLDTLPKYCLDQADAILVVHYAGRPADMGKILYYAKKYNLTVIEDCAHSCGAEYKGFKTGNIGDIGCFSFHAVKNLSCGDGGMITTNSEAVYRSAKRRRWLGISGSTYERPGWEYEIEEPGFKCHMNDISASLGITQLCKLDEMNKRRSKLAERYTSKLQNVKTPLNDDDIYKSSWHLYQVQIENRNDLYDRMKSNGVQCGVHYKPMYDFKAYRKWKVECPVADERWKNLLSLPIYPEMTEQEQDKVIELIDRGNA